MEKEVKPEKIKGGLLIALLLLPSLALAHGEGTVITTFFIELIRLVIFIVLLVILNLTRTGKLIWILTYILGLVIAYAMIWQIPYRDNKTMVD